MEHRVVQSRNILDTSLQFRRKARYCFICCKGDVRCPHFSVKIPNLNCRNVFCNGKSYVLQHKHQLNDCQCYTLIRHVSVTDATKVITTSQIQTVNHSNWNPIKFLWQKPCG